MMFLYLSGLTASHLHRLRIFIKLAQETNVVSVLALLMDYKNTHFDEFDPMDEFTLDLI